MNYEISHDPVSLKTVTEFALQKKTYNNIHFSKDCLNRIESSHHYLLKTLEQRVPIYGVNTGYGASCHRTIENNQSEQLQNNLIGYLQCGSGRNLNADESRAMCVIRLHSLSRGFSGVSEELILHLGTLLEHDILPVVPVEGSLGASGDLIPLSYLGALVMGQGNALTADGVSETSDVFRSKNIEPYRLKAKEGLALVNGTSAMAGVSLINLEQIKCLTSLQLIATSWLCLALDGKTEAFGPLVNQHAKNHDGQTVAAATISKILAEENYTPVSGLNIKIKESLTDGVIQDRYSLRCSPQILGPIIDTAEVFSTWLEQEINSVSDNPLIDPNTGDIAMGGNFYGGYLSQGMDYLKISIANMADHIDRQLTTLFDEQANRKLPPNLANWKELPEDQRHLHHGLKALHQATNAITSEIMAMATPNSIFSRSSESHNQDKVSLGMSAAVSCGLMIEKLFTIQTLNIVCLAQALDLKEIQLKGESSQKLYNMIRNHIPFVTHDQELGSKLKPLTQSLKTYFRSHGDMY